MENDSSNANSIEAAVLEAGLRVVVEECKSIATKVLAGLAGRHMKIRGRLAISVERFLESEVERLKCSPIPFFGDEKHYLYSFYVPMDLQGGTGEMQSPSLLDVLRDNRCCVISGTGGSGKSTFMKHLFLTGIASGEYIPIFLELRNINDMEGGIEELLATRLLGKKYPETGVAFVQGLLASGRRIAVLLDAFDEVVHEKSEQVAEDIVHLSEKYPSCSWVVSTRPMDKDFLGQNFKSFDAKPLTLEKTRELIEKLRIDEGLRSRFLTEIDDMFEEHKYFLSTPLLLLVFLITYKEFASIPKSLHRFFEHAFYTLFNKHDAMKDGYSRELVTKLDGSRFQTAVAAFCALSYSKSKWDFAPLELESFLASSKVLSGIDFAPKMMRQDLVTAVCILIKDGQSIRFSHRLFQEYFTAVYLDKTVVKDKEKLIRKVCMKSAESDQVMSMLWGINRQLAEKTVVLPFLDDMAVAIGYKGRVSRAVVTKFISYVFDSVEFSYHFRSGGKIRIRAWLGSRHGSPRRVRKCLVDFVSDQYRYIPQEVSGRDRDRLLMKILSTEYGIDFENVDKLARQQAAENYNGESDVRLIEVEADELDENGSLAEHWMHGGGYWGVDQLRFLFSIRTRIMEAHAGATHFAFDELLNGD